MVTANQVYELIVHRYMVYTDDTDDNDDNDDNNNDDNNNNNDNNNDNNNNDHPFDDSLTTIAGLLSTSDDDDRVVLMSDVHVHRVLVSIRCLKDLHYAQQSPVDWHGISDIVERASKVEELVGSTLVFNTTACGHLWSLVFTCGCANLCEFSQSLLPFPVSEISRLHRALCQHVAIQRLLTAMQEHGSFRPTTSGGSGGSGGANGATVVVRRGSTLLLDR